MAHPHALSIVSVCRKAIFASPVFKLKGSYSTAIITSICKVLSVAFGTENLCDFLMYLREKECHARSQDLVPKLLLPCDPG